MSEVTKYRVHIGAWKKKKVNPSDNYVTITLLNGTKIVAMIWFYERDELPEDELSMSGDVMNFNLPISLFNTVIDLLRNEKPIWITIGHPFIGPPGLMFGDEPVGEAE